MKHSDFIIVGQGLAGSILALRLKDKGFSVVLIDKPELSNCSKIAAGIYNPVVFKRLTKSWMLDEIYPEMHSFYNSLEKKWNCTLITPRNIVKLFSEQQEIDLWNKKAGGELNSYLDPTIYITTSYQNIKLTESGYSKVIRSGNLDVMRFLDQTKSEFEREGNYLNETFEHTELKLEAIIRYKNISAKNIIFCEGHLVRQNPLFDHIPFKPAKGEVLSFESDDLKIGEDIINKNAFVLNLVGKSFKAGSTYNWEDMTDQPTDDGRKDIETKLKKIISANYKITSHQAGVRPSVIDRRPVIGAHYKYKNVFVFNGLGTKGVMLAPYFASHFIDHLTLQHPLNREVDVSRFSPLK